MEVMDKLRESEFYYQQGQNHFSAGNFDLAISCFEECVKIGHPFFKSTSLLNLSEIYRKIGENDKKIAYYKEMVALPDEERKFLPSAVMGMILSRLGDFDGAAKSYERAMHLKPDDGATAMNFVELEILRGAYESASALLTSWKESKDSKIFVLSRFLYLVLLIIQKREKEVAGALSDFVSAVRSLGVPPDLHWDFTDLTPLLGGVTEANHKEMLDRIVDLLTRRLIPAEYLKLFPAF